MSDSSNSSHCQRCGAAIPDAPEGLCPRCLMAQVMQPTQAGDSAGAMPPFKPEEIAPHFPQLEILGCLGRGGMGVVYKARQKSLNRLVALKLLAPERADDPHFAARFEKEAQALATLNHPHIVGVHDFGQAGGFYYLLMEFVDGVNLRQLLQTRRLAPKEALSIVPPVCDALQCAHDHGIVHRDIKPENLLIDKAGKVKIADFGVAKMLGATPSHLPPLALGQDVASQAFGTPDYAAPEQANGQSDHRADIYSLGVVLYEMLTGERPKDKLEAPSKRVQVDIRIDEIVLRALEKTPELRFATATEFRTQVEAVTQEAPPAWSPPEAGWGWLVGKMFGITFRSRRAFLLANLSALGFLAFLGFVPLPGWQRCFGFAGFFGLIGVAFLVELSASKFWPTQRGGAAPPTNPWPRRIFILLALLVAIPVVLFLGVLVPVYQSIRAMARETRQAHEANRRERESAQDKRVAYEPNPSPASADGFDFPVGAPNGKGYHVSREAFTHGGQKTEHTGEDWDGDGGGNSDLGDPVYAVADGLVMFSKDAKLGHGNVIIVQHTYQEADGRQAVCESSYHHLLERLVETGARVKRGQKIGTLGSNSGMYPSHLHFELRKTPGMGLEQSPFKKNTENYWQPSQFIREHRPTSQSSGMMTKPVILQYIEATRARDELLKLHPELAGALGRVNPETNTLPLLSESPQFEQAQRALEELDRRPDQIFLQCEIREAVKGIPRSADEKVVARPTFRGLMNQPASFYFGSRETDHTRSASNPALKLTLHPVAEPPASRQTTPPRISLSGVITESNSSLPSGEHVTRLETMTVASGGTVEFIHTTLGERTFRFLISARWISGSKPAPALTTTIQGTMSDADLKKLSWHEFDQTPGKYWRELAGVRRFKEAAELIEKMLSLHPDLEHLNAANLHFHAGQCWAMAGEKANALNHLKLARHPADSTPVLRWNDYVRGTEAFLNGDKNELLNAHENLARSASINQPNLRVLDRLLACFGKSYAEAYETDGQDHQKLSVDCFNRAWELLDKKDRPQEDDQRMMSLAHASLAHWRMRKDCTDRNLSIGYWQLSRVYAVLGQGNNAERYGGLCLRVSGKEPPFYHAYAHEALARAALLNERKELFDKHLSEAKALAAKVSDATERKALEDDLASLVWKP